METIAQGQRRGSIIAPPPAGYGNSGPGDSGSSFPISKAHLGTWILLTAVTMLFAGLSSAYIVLRGVPEWQNITMPSLLWANTLVLVASSVAIEFARSGRRQKQADGVKQGLSVSGIFVLDFSSGSSFLGAAGPAGVYLQTNWIAHFFRFTGAQALHFFGGIFGLLIG